MVETESSERSPDPTFIVSSKDDLASFYTAGSTPSLAEAQKQIETIGNELRQKQRLLTGLNRSLKPIDKRLAEEIYNRDRFIDELNIRLMDIQTNTLETKLKRIKEKDQQLENLQDANQRLLQEKMQISEKLATKDMEIANLQLEFDNEREEMEMHKEELRQAIADQELMTDANAVETKDVKADIVQLAQIVQNMTGINKDLNDKITQLNAAMEETNNRIFAADVQVSSTEQLEATLVEQTNLASENQRRLNKAEKTAHRLKTEKALLIE